MLYYCREDVRLPITRRQMKVGRALWQISEGIFAFRQITTRATGLGNYITELRSNRLQSRLVILNSACLVSSNCCLCSHSKGMAEDVQWKEYLNFEESREIDNSLFFEYEFSVDQLMEVVGICIAQVSLQFRLHPTISLCVYPAANVLKLTSHCFVCRVISWSH